MQEWIERQRRIVRAAHVSANVLFPLFLALWGHFVDEMDWDDVWEVFYGEGNAITWFSSVQLLFVAALCYLTYATTWLVDARAGGRTRFRDVWRLLALAFAFLACDEYFMFHEQLREQLLKPRGLFTDVPSLKPGDIGLFLYLAAGLLMLYFLWQILRSRRSSVVLFAAGLLLMIPLAVLDAFEIPFFWSHVELWNNYVIVEEVGENACQMLFGLGVAGILFDRLAALCAEPAGSAGR
jgi:hypothetical protein